LDSEGLLSESGCQLSAVSSQLNRLVSGAPVGFAVLSF